jgi:hypothetical protein
VRALEQGISIAPGLIFSNTEQFNHCIRLNCGIPWNKEAERAVMTLGLLAQQLCRSRLTFCKACQSSLEQGAYAFSCQPVHLP